MNQRLKRWESPRREGRNDKGRGGSARARQLKKQMQMLRQRLKEGGGESPSQEQRNQNNRKQGEEKLILLPVFLALKLNIYRTYTRLLSIETLLLYYFIFSKT